MPSPTSNTPTTTMLDTKKISIQAEKNGEAIMKIARKYGIHELDLLKAIGEVSDLPRLFEESVYRAQEQADCDMRLTTYKAELIEKIEVMDTPVAGMIWKDRVLAIIKEK